MNYLITTFSPHSLFLFKFHRGGLLFATLAETGKGCWYAAAPIVDMTNKNILSVWFVCSGRICERCASGSREVQVLPQGAYGHVRQPSAVARCGEGGEGGSHGGRLCFSDIAMERHDKRVQELNFRRCIWQILRPFSLWQGSHLYLLIRPLPSLIPFHPSPWVSAALWSHTNWEPSHFGSWSD